MKLCEPQSVLREQLLTLWYAIVVGKPFQNSVYIPKVNTFNASLNTNGLLAGFGAFCRKKQTVEPTTIKLWLMLVVEIKPNTTHSPS